MQKVLAINSSYVQESNFRKVISFFSVLKNLIYAIQIPVWIVERAPEQDLEVTDAAAHQATKESTAQVSIILNRCHYIWAGWQSSFCLQLQADEALGSI